MYFRYCPGKYGTVGRSATCGCLQKRRYKMTLINWSIIGTLRYIHAYVGSQPTGSIMYDCQCIENSTLCSCFFYRPFTSNTAAQCIYFFKSLYFIVSAMQIVSGYPTHVLGYFLGQKYTTVSGLLFSGYRAIPLLPELREVMDWVFTDTALPLLHWLRVQEIYAKLYLVKVRRMREKVLFLLLK